jgi:hypothetical protein
MAQIRKPIPKTPAQEVQDKIVPYELASYGKEPMVSKPNRALKVSQKGSREKNFSVKLVDIDTAVLEHIKNNIKPTVYSNTELIDVPVIYAYPERWVAMQKEGFLRDVSGKIIAPLIVVNRTDVTKNRNVGRNLDGNLAQNVHVFERQFTNKNAYDNFNVLNNRQPVKEMMVVAHPDYVTITYEINIYADFVEQSNRIIEAIQYAENSYWGDKNRYYFRVNIDSFPVTVQYSAEEERTVSSKLTVKLHGYLIPDTINAYLSHDMAYVSKGQVIFNEYAVNDLLVPIVKKPKQINVNPISPSPINPATFAAVSQYINTNNSATATVVSTNQAILYGKQIMVAPSPLPPTGKSQFVVLVNGINIEPDFFNLQQVGNDIVFTFDISLSGLGYGLNLPSSPNPDSVLIIGKFQ